METCVMTRACPLRVRAVELREAEGSVCAMVSLTNRRDQRVRRVDAVLRWRVPGTGRVAVLPITRRGIGLRREGTLQVELPGGLGTDGNELDLTITRVEYEDDTPPWRAGA